MILTQVRPLSPEEQQQKEKEQEKLKNRLRKGDEEVCREEKSRRERWRAAGDVCVVCVCVRALAHACILFLCSNPASYLFVR